jgi:serine/threonine protein kinase
MTRPAKLIGEVLDGKYQLDKQLGQGGMGAVYLATHLGTKRPVALKVIAPQFMANAEFVERFRREAEAAGRLRHPNVVNVTDFGFAQMGRDTVAYLVMEYLDGGSLGDMLKERGRLPLPLVTDILEQICLAVGNAHRLGVIHRDLKPDNIWLQPDGRGGYIAKVLDFGLAKLRDPGELHLGDGAGSADTTARVTERGAQTVKAGVQTAAEQAERTNLQGDSRGAATAIAAEEQTALFDPPQTTFKESEGETRIQPPPHASVAEDDGATLIQPPPAETMSDDDGATLIHANVEANVEGATLIQANAESAVAGPSRSSSLSASTGARSASSHPSTTGSLSGDTSAVDLTRVGSIMGTPLYMSPEQCRSEPLDARSDIYSLGIIVYQSLAGEAPFKGDMTELMRKHVEDAPPPLREKRADIPAAVADLVAATLAKQPADRPPNAEAFASAFRATAEGEKQILRTAKANYYTAQRLFFTLSLVVYAPFAVVSFAASLAFNRVLSKSGVATLIFYVSLYALVLLATRVMIGACTVATAEVRLKSAAAVKLKAIIKVLAGRLPSLVVTGVQGLAYILFGLLKLVVPGGRAYVDQALAPSAVMIEDVRGATALRRSKRLIGPLRSIAVSLLARDFGIGVVALLLFPFMTFFMALLFSGTRVDAFEAMRVPTFRNFIVIYCWFLLTMMHTVYCAVPIATLYFKARQANGELLDERGTRDWQAETVKRPGRMSRAAVIWLMIPIVMLALMVLSSFWAGGFGEDSLIELARKGRRQSVAKKLAAGANPNDSRLSTTVLMFAAKDGYTDIVRDLLQAGARLDAKDNDGDTALMYAAIDDRVDVVRALLMAGADANAQNNKGDTPLMAAALRDRTEVVKALLAGGADPNLRNQRGQTALSLAEYEGHRESIEMLKKADASGGQSNSTRRID